MNDDELLRQSARLESQKAYVKSLETLSNEDLQHEFRMRESLPDCSAAIEAEMRRRKLQRLEQFGKKAG